MFRVDISKIVYFEADGNYTKFVMCNGLEGVVCTNLTQMKNILSERLGETAGMFARIGKSYIINLNHISNIPPYGRWTYVVRLTGITQDALITHEKYEELERMFS